MNILCKLFGHTISGTYYKPSGYTRCVRATGGAIDNIHRHHIELYAECDRCGEQFHVANVHGTPLGNVLLSETDELLHASIMIENNKQEKKRIEEIEKAHRKAQYLKLKNEFEGEIENESE